MRIYFTGNFYFLLCFYLYTLFLTSSVSAVVKYSCKIKAWVDIFLTVSTVLIFFVSTFMSSAKSTCEAGLAFLKFICFIKLSISHLNTVIFGIWVLHFASKIMVHKTLMYYIKYHTLKQLLGVLESCIGRKLFDLCQPFSLIASPYANFYFFSHPSPSYRVWPTPTYPCASILTVSILNTATLL